MTKSATVPTTVLTVDELFAVLGSVVPPGGLAVAVFASDPLADGETEPLMVIVTLDPAGIVGTTPDTKFPAKPIEAGHTAPPVALAQLAAMPVTAAGTLSLNVAPDAGLGPSLRITKL